MNSLPRLVLAALPLCATLSCADPAPMAPASAVSRLAGTGPEAAPAPRLTVMTQNLYVGANVDLVIGALLTPDQDDDFPTLLAAIATLGNTAYPARAEAIAGEIARTRPHAVGLQEVSDIDIELGPVGVPVSFHLAFLEILQDALSRRGLQYEVAATVTNTQVQLVQGLVSLVDRDVLLVDAERVEVTAAGGQTFTARVPPEAVGGINLIRGWVWADVVSGGAPYKLVSLHAEANLAGQSLSLLRAGQMIELVSTLSSDAPTILLGDFNDAPGSPMYEVLRGAGFTDVWAELRPGAVGNTCCHADDLSDVVGRFSQRIDYVFARGMARGPADKIFGTIDRYGEVPADRVAGPAYAIWPSDHVGLVATLSPLGF